MRTLVLICVIALNLSVYGQKGSTVPASVKNSFSQKFPNITRIKWSAESKTEWEAEFRFEGRAYSANFDTDGNWVETEYKIKENEIPPLIKETIGKEFANYTIRASEISETASGKLYEFILRKGHDKVEAAFDSNGTLVKKENLSKKSNND